MNEVTSFNSEIKQIPEQEILSTLCRELNWRSC